MHRSRAGVAAAPRSARDGRPRSWFDHLALADDRDARVGDREPALDVPLLLVADGRAVGDDHVLVDDGPLDAAVPPDLHAVEDDAAVDLGVAVHVAVGGDDRAVDPGAGD